MRNEAAERLRWHKETGQTVISITKCEEAVAAEREATVDRIRAAAGLFPTESHLWTGNDEYRRWLAILDAEAKR